jgi:hypothetical protein
MRKTVIGLINSEETFQTNKTRICGLTQHIPPEMLLSLSP